MKKTYLIPSTDIAVVETQQMIAFSLGDDPTSKSYDLSDPNAETTDQTSGNLSRRRSVWGDEEEFEELY